MSLRITRLVTLAALLLALVPAGFARHSSRKRAHSRNYAHDTSGRSSLRGHRDGQYIEGHRRNRKGGHYANRRKGNRYRRQKS